VSAYHVEGLEFTREEDGFVLIRSTHPAARLSPKQWAGVVARVSKRGQLGETAAKNAQADALTLHTMPGEERELTGAQVGAALRAKR
jgi:hypothetical protein